MSLLVAILLEFAKVAVSAVACVWSVLVVSGSLRQLGIEFKALTGVTTVVDTSLGGCRGLHKCCSLSIKAKAFLRGRSSSVRIALIWAGRPS